MQVILFPKHKLVIFMIVGLMILLLSSTVISNSSFQRFFYDDEYRKYIVNTITNSATWKIISPFLSLPISIPLGMMINPVSSNGPSLVEIENNIHSWYPNGISTDEDELIREVIHSFSKLLPEINYLENNKEVFSELTTEEVNHMLLIRSENNPYLAYDILGYKNTYGDFACERIYYPFLGFMDVIAHDINPLWCIPYSSEVNGIGTHKSTGLHNASEDNKSGMVYSIVKTTEINGSIEYFVVTLDLDYLHDKFRYIIEEPNTIFVLYDTKTDKVLASCNRDSCDELISDTESNPQNTKYLIVEEIYDEGYYWVSGTKIPNIIGDPYGNLVNISHDLALLEFKKP